MKKRFTNVKQAIEWFKTLDIDVDYDYRNSKYNIYGTIDLEGKYPSIFSSEEADFSTRMSDMGYDREHYIFGKSCHRQGGGVYSAREITALANRISTLIVFS